MKKTSLGPTVTAGSLALPPFRMPSHFVSTSAPLTSRSHACACILGSSVYKNRSIDATPSASAYVPIHCFIRSTRRLSSSEKKRRVGESAALRDPPPSAVVSVRCVRRHRERWPAFPTRFPQLLLPQTAG